MEPLIEIAARLVIASAEFAIESGGRWASEHEGDAPATARVPEPDDDPR